GRWGRGKSGWLQELLPTSSGARPEPPLQVGAELKSCFFASQGCARSPIQKHETAFAMKDPLRAHTVGREQKVPCHACGKMLSSPYILDHLKMHSQGPHPVCELCHKGTGEVCPMATAAAVAAPPTAVGSLLGVLGVPVSSQPLPSQPW
ncbi:hypothetical protein FD755_012896, partial [Muntiacus reevesi]